MTFLACRLFVGSYVGPFQGPHCATHLAEDLNGLLPLVQLLRIAVQHSCAMSKG